MMVVLTITTNNKVNSKLRIQLRKSYLKQIELGSYLKSHLFPKLHLSHCYSNSAAQLSQCYSKMPIAMLFS